LSDEEGIHSVKKISRAGSGGYSIYLPKKWISGWSEEQKESREVEIRKVGEHLILTPKINRRSYKGVSRGESRDELIYHVLSAYINGVDDFRIIQDGLNDMEMGEIRNTMRFLDENLSVRTEEGTIEYENRPVVTYDVSHLLPLLFEKVIEAENLAADLINDCDSNPKRCIHIMRMMHGIEKEDVNRLTLQVFRNLSMFRGPLRSFIDVNFMWSSANMLEIIGDALFGIVQVVCRCYGLDPNELQYPAEYLEGKIKEDFEVLGEAEKLRMQLVIDMREAAIMLDKAREAIISGDGRGAFEYKDEIREQVRAMESEMADGIGDFCASCQDEKIPFLPVMLMSIRAREIMYLTKSLTKRAALVYFNE